MALLRPCGRIIQAFSKSSIAHQIEYIRGLASFERIQGYVTVAQKFGSSNAILEKTETSSNSTTFINDSTARVQRELETLCQQFRNRYIQTQSLLLIVENYELNPVAKNDGSAYLVLLRCCGNMLPHVALEYRRNLTNQIWNLLNEKLSQPTLEHYNALLSIHAQNLQIVDTKDFLDSMKVKPDVTTYQMLLDVSAKFGDVKSSLYVLSLMKEIGSSLSISVFNSLMEAHTVSGDVTSALSILKTIRASGVEPNIETHAIIARLDAFVGDIESVRKFLNGHEPSTKQILEIVKSLSISGHGKHIPEVLKFLPSHVDETDPTVISKITELTHAGKYSDALEIVIRVARIESTEETNHLIHYYLKNVVGTKPSIDVILKIINHLMEIKKYSLAMIDVCEAALNSGQRKLTMKIFELLHEKSISIRPHYYWPLLVKASKEGGEADIFHTIKHMLCLNVRLDYDTLYDYVFPFINTFDPLITLRRFDDLGVGISVLSTSLVCYLLVCGNINDALKVCSSIESTIDFNKVLSPLSIAYRVNYNADICAQIFKYAPREKCYSDEFLKILHDSKSSKLDTIKINKLLRAFKDLGIPVSRDFDLVTSEENTEKPINDTPIYLSNIERVKNKFLHPRDMSLNDLECHLIELRSKGMNTRGTLRRLLMLQCRENNVARVDEIKKEYDENGFLWTAGMYTSLMMFYSNNNRTKEALHVYRELREYSSHFKIDDYKIIHLSSALVKENQMDEVIAMLESARSNGGPVIEKESWRLLNAVAHSSSSEMTENILDILVNGGYCKKTNVILGPLVRPYLLKNDLAKAVEVFKKYAARYQCTPLCQELVNALVKAIKEKDSKENELIALLNDVQNVTEQLFGVGTAKMHLFIGLVQNGMKEESRTFFEKHRVSDHTFINKLWVKPESQSLQVLTDILECNNLSTQKTIIVYEKILSIHCKTGDCQSAIALWRKMSKQLTTSPRMFMANFVSLLENHNVPLPEDFNHS